MNCKIKKIIAREILDSRGNPTVEVDLFVDKCFVRASVPSGASVGIYEAHELRDGGRRYSGKGVLHAVSNVNKVISKKISGMDCRAQREIDNALIEFDGTEKKSRLGANALLAASIAACRAGALCKGIHLYKHIGQIFGNRNFRMPVPFFNVINGGRHAGNGLVFQEFMIVPKIKRFSEALRAGSEVYHALKEVIKDKYGRGATNVGDEGGFAPQTSSAEEALNLLAAAVKKAGYEGKIKFAIDAAASEFFRFRHYFLPKRHTKQHLLDYYLRLIKKYPIISIEDPFSQDDFGAFALLTKKSGIQVVGDDLLATNIKRIQRAVENKACNCLLLKPNQIGTVTEALDAARAAMQHGWKVMVSHRSGETCDDFIAELAVGIGCGQIKAGAPCRGERTAKYNQLLRIEGMK